MTRQLMTVAKGSARNMIPPISALQAGFDLLRWYPFLAKNHFPLRLKHGWSMGVQDFEFILSFIQLRKSIKILELGSGMSTLIFASELAKTHEMA